MGRTTEPTAGVAVGEAKAAPLPTLPAQIVYRPEDLDAIYERRLRVVESSWDKAAAYDTAITVVGYAAFFALWAGVAQDISSTARAWTASLMGVSLLLFVGWHLLGMVTRHLHDREFVTSMQKVQQPIDAINEWDAIELKKRRSLMAVQRFWIPVFGTAVLTGMGGALLLIYNCIAPYFGWDHFPA